MGAVFQGGQKYNGGFRADRVRLMLRDARGQALPADGYIMQDINYDYQQSLAMIYEIGSNFVYFVGGRAQGTAGFGQIMGPTQLILAFLDNYGDQCYPKSISLLMGGNCNLGAGRRSNGVQLSPGDAADVVAARVANSRGLAVLLESAVMNRVGGNTNAQNIIVNHQSQFMFLNLDYSATDLPA